jgi:hypothetical protein
MKNIGSVLSSNNEEDNYSLLMMYKDYTLIMHIASKKTHSFYSKLKLCLTIVNLFLSASSSAISAAYMNTTLEPSKLESRTLFGMNIVIKSGMVINFIMCLIIGFMYIFEIAQKELYFKIYADNYLRLNNAIVAEISLNKGIQKDYIKFVLFEFTFLIENSKYDIPMFVKRKIKKGYSQYNIPPYIDIYINNFNTPESISYSKWTKWTKWLRIFQKECKCDCEKMEGVDIDIIDKSVHGKRMSPMIRSYSFESQYKYIYDMENIKTDNVLSNILVYNNENCYTNASNISPLLCNFKISSISSFNPDTYE